jgi:hypothetical protein
MKSIYIATLKEIKGARESSGRDVVGEERERIKREEARDASGEEEREIKQTRDGVAFVPFDRRNSATFRSKMPRTGISLRTCALMKMPSACENTRFSSTS